MTEPVNEQHMANMGLAGVPLGQPYEEQVPKSAKVFEKDNRCPAKYQHAQCARTTLHEGKHARGTFLWTDEEAPPMPDPVRCTVTAETNLPGYPTVRCVRSAGHVGTHVWKSEDGEATHSWDNDSKKDEPAHEEAVNHPAHYGGADNPYEAIKVIEAWDLGFCLGNTVKYLSRAGKKSGEQPLKDLKKALWYLQREIDTMEGGNDGGT